MTFKDYLFARKARYDAQGDFIRLAKADPKMPDAATWEELRSYLQGRGDDSMQIEIGHQVWVAYSKMMRPGKPAA